MRCLGTIILLGCCVSACDNRALDLSEAGVDDAAVADAAVPDLPDWACASTSGVGQAIYGKVDLLWFIDTSRSMSQETTWVQQNLNDFAAYIAEQQIDYHVILIGADDICVPPPLGGDDCSDGERYLHVKQQVNSHDGLEQIIATYPEWQSFLRADASKNFVAVTDDNSDKSAAWFNEQLASLTDPGVGSYYFHSIVSYGDVAEKGCSTGAAVGEVYLELTSQSGGTKYQICQEDWNGIFNSLAKHVTSTSKPPCSYLIPDPGEEQVLDPAQVAVSHLDQTGTTQLTRVSSADTCVDDGWYYDDEVEPTTVVFCPETCSALSGGTISIAFGCQ